MTSLRRCSSPLLALLTIPALACGDAGTATDGPATDAATTSTSAGPTSATEPATTAPTSEPGTTSPTSVGPVSDASSDPTTGPNSTTTTTDPTASTSASTGAVSASTTDTNSTSDGTTGDPPCPADTIFCEGDTAKVCDGLGGFKSEEACPDACVDDIGCTLCVPGEGSCQGDQALVCNNNGDGFDLVDTCDALLGLACDPNLGACAGACAGLGLSYIGCEYYPTVVQQFDGYNTAPTFEYAVAVANASDKVAKVTVTRGPNMVAQVDVQPTSVQLIKLPWVNELSSGYGPSVVVPDGAYRLRSTNPVTVYQYNPLTVTYTNDASVLLPTNTWTGNYLVAAWPTWPFGNQAVPGLYAVTARQDNTTVTLHPSATGKIVKPGGGVAADGTGVVMLNEGDVLEVLSNYNGDVTGTIIEADKPVQVIGGHKCTNVPLNVTACDHLEESMFPIETLAKEYVVVPPVQVPNDQAEKGQIIRVIASEANTTPRLHPRPAGRQAARQRRRLRRDQDHHRQVRRHRRQEDPRLAVHGRPGRRLRHQRPRNARHRQPPAVAQDLPVPRRHQLAGQLRRYPRPQERRRHRRRRQRRQLAARRRHQLPGRPRQAQQPKWRQPQRRRRRRRRHQRLRRPELRQLLVPRRPRPRRDPAVAAPQQQNDVAHNGHPSPHNDGFRKS
ncbi:MAG: hypothetical protein IPJ59_09710 [Nannocystis sp.]|nr:hypothetical protein [Nannocystis sp.]MBK7825474.1 hypothetical protein [Nannocystis sp.]